MQTHALVDISDQHVLQRRVTNRVNVHPRKKPLQQRIIISLQGDFQDGGLQMIAKVLIIAAVRLVYFVNEHSSLGCSQMGPLLFQVPRHGGALCVKSRL
jgi:hypothetical protein